MSLVVKLVREESTDQGTFGILTFERHELRTLELPWRGNQVQLSCIPGGVYSVVMIRSPKFGRVYGVQSVPGRSNVLIHSANFGGDVHLGWDTQLHGCIAPHRRRGFLLNSHGKMQRAGLISRPALTELMSWADGRPFQLEITA